MERSHMLKLFNDRLREFIQDISRIYPPSKELGMAHTIMSQIDPSKPLKIFNELIRVPYADRIRNRDEGLLFSNDVDSQVARIGSGSTIAGKTTGDNGFDILAQLRSIWSNIGPNDREAIWKHLNVLVIVAEKA